MRIFHLLKHCERGNGHVHVATDLACEQAVRGHDVVFASGGGTYVSLLEGRGVRHRIVEQSPRQAFRGLASLLALVGRHRPHVVHAHMMAASAMGYLATRLRGGALVTTVHNSFDRHSGLMRLGDAIAAVSSAERDLLLARGYPSDRVITVYNGPLGSAREVLRADGTLEAPRPCVMTLSGLHGRKRVDDAISAFALVAPRWPDWRLVIVGEGPDETKLRDHAASLGVSDRVVFAGRSLNPASLLRQASIFLCLSEAEPFGLVVAEARAAGCAVVVTRVGGMPEVVEGGKAGILVPVRGVEAAAEALDELMSSPAALAHWRAAALEGSGRFSVGAMADGYDAVYRDAMVRRPALERPSRTF